MFTTIILYDKDNPDSVAEQQVEGLIDTIARYLNRDSTAFTDTFKDNLICVKPDNPKDIEEQLRNLSVDTRYLIVGSERAGLSGFITVCQFFQFNSAFTIPRNQVSMIWTGADILDDLYNPALQLDLTIVPMWKHNRYQSSGLKIRSNKIFWNYAGIFTDWDRKHFAYLPPELKSIGIYSTSVKLIGLILGDCTLYSNELIEFWLEKIIEEKPELHFFIFTTATTTGDKRRDMIAKIQEVLTKKNLPFNVYDDHSQYNGQDANVVAMMPVMLNLIESENGEIYIAGDLLPMAYNILESSNSLNPYVRILVPQRPSQHPKLIDQDFFEANHQETYEFCYDHKPWLTVVPRRFDDTDLLNLLEEIINPVKTEEIRKPSRMAKFCRYLSQVTLFKKRQKGYNMLPDSSQRSPLHADERERGPDFV